MRAKQRVRLTQKIVNGIVPGKPDRIWDESLIGFGVRISPGAVSYFVDQKVGSVRKFPTLGPTNLLTLAEARDRAREIRAAARKGEDATLDPRKGMLTFAEVWRQMIEEVDRPKLSPATIISYEERAKGFLEKFGKKLVGDVTPADVDRVVSATKGERSRAYVVALIKKAINHAKRARILPESHRNPAADVKIKKVVKQPARALEVDEIASFGKALAEMEAENKVSPWLANLFRLSLICGLRPGEVRTLTWDRVNLPRAKMQVVGKTGGREIHLTAAAIEVLASVPKVQGCEYVFAGRRFGQPIAGVHKMLGLVQERAGIEKFRPYDLRHSAATGALASGADVRAVQALLGHADLKTTAGYLHASSERRKTAAERAAAFGRGVLRNG